MLLTESEQFKHISAILALKSSKLDISPKQKVRSNQTTQICSETKFMEICLYLLYGRTPAFFGNQNKEFLCQSFVTITSQRIAAWEQRVHDHDVNRLQKQPGSLPRSKTLARAVKEKVWSKVETGNFSRHKRLVPCKTDFEKKRSVLQTAVHPCNDPFPIMMFPVDCRWRPRLSGTRLAERRPHQAAIKTWTKQN